MTCKHMQPWHKHQQSQVPTWPLGQRVLSQDPPGIGHLKDHWEDHLEEDGHKGHKEDRLEEDGLKDYQEDHLEEDGPRDCQEDHQEDKDQLYMAGLLALWQEDNPPHSKEIEISQKHSWMNGTSITSIIVFMLLWPPHINMSPNASPIYLGQR